MTANTTEPGRESDTVHGLVRHPQSDNMLEIFAEVTDPARWAAMMLTTKPLPPGTTVWQAQDIVVNIFEQAMGRAHGDLVRDNEKLRKALREVADWFIDKQHFEHAAQLLELLKTCRSNTKDQVS